MSSKRTRALVALAAAAAMGLTACGGSNGSNGGSGGGGGSSENKFNAALGSGWDPSTTKGGGLKFRPPGGSVWNPSTTKGGVLKFAHTGDWSDSVDPGNTYYGYSWDFLRTYARSLVMFRPAAGKASEQLVPDLAESLGKPSDGAKTWTYKI